MLEEQEEEDMSTHFGCGTSSDGSEGKRDPKPESKLKISAPTRTKTRLAT